MMRPLKQSQECEMIDSANKSYTDSLLFMKRVTGLVISQLTYNRNLFNEDDFSDNKFCGIPIKVIKTGGSSPYAGILNKWVVGAMDALDRKYLRSFTLEIADSTGDCFESYTFEYTYLNDEIQCSVTTIEDQIKLSSKLKDSVRGVIRNLMTLTTTAPPLPPGARTVIKISYHPDTPLDYEPPGFKPYLDDTSTTNKMELKYTCGKISTLSHSMEVKIKLKDL